MSNGNKTTRTILRWMHLLVGFPIGVFVDTPARENDAFVLLMQVAVIPAVTLTGLWMWQQGRIRRLRRNPRCDATNGSETLQGTHRNANVSQTSLNLVIQKDLGFGR